MEGCTCPDGQVFDYIDGWLFIFLSKYNVSNYIMFPFYLKLKNCMNISDCSCRYSNTLYPNGSVINKPCSDW